VQPDTTKHWPRRPPSLSRLFDSGRPFYFVTFNTYKRWPLLARPEVHEAFCIFCQKAQEHDVAVGRYVIMPDHIHLFAAFPGNGVALPNWVQSLRAIIGKRLLRIGVQKAALAGGVFRSSTTQF
jgi:REP element-mobilizing transposase RayT